MNVDGADGGHSASFLSIPTRMPRSGSHDSFATDLSMLSLSSFTSEAFQQRQQNEDPEEEDFLNSELAKHREDMLEKMLEVSSFSLPLLSATSKLKSRGPKECTKAASKPPSGNIPGSKQKTGGDTMPSIQSSDEISALTREKSLKGSLYKCLSTSDLFHVSLDSEGFCEKRHASQTWIPCYYAQVWQCRRRHFAQMGKNMPSSSDMKYVLGMIASTDVSTPDSFPSTHNQNPTRRSLKASFFRRDDSQGRLGADELIHFKSTSAESLPMLLNVRESPGLFMKRLKFSKEVGRRIRDDLLRKLGKQKQKIVTKMDLEKEKGRPVTKNERNFMIFHWLQSLDEGSFDDP